MPAAEFTCELPSIDHVDCVRIEVMPNVGKHVDLVEVESNQSIVEGNENWFYAFFFLPYQDDYNDRSVLYSSEFLSQSWLWVWRIITMLGTIAICTSEWVLSMHHDLAKSFSYLTIWTMFLTCVYFTTSFFVLVYGYFTSQRNTPMKWPELLYTLTFEVTFGFNFVVVILFWTLVFNPSEGFPNKTDLILNILIHALGLGLMIFETLCNRLKFQYKHYLYALSIATVYMFVNFIYVKLTNVALYPTLTWGGNGAWTIISIAGALILLFIAFALGNNLTKLRKYLNCC